MLNHLLESALSKSGLSASEVARRAGLHVGTVSRWINDPEREPRMVDALKVGEILRIPRKLILEAYGVGVPKKRAKTR